MFVKFREKCVIEIVVLIIKCRFKWDFLEHFFFNYVKMRFHFVIICPQLFCYQTVFTNPYLTSHQHTTLHFLRLTQEKMINGSGEVGVL